MGSSFQSGCESRIKSNERWKWIQDSLKTKRGFWNFLLLGTKGVTISTHLHFLSSTKNSFPAPPLRPLLFPFPHPLTMVPLLHQRPLYWTLHYSIGVLTLADLLKHLSATCTFRSHPVQAIPVLHPPGLPQLPLTSSIPLLPIPTFKSWGPFLPCSLTVCFQHCLFASLFHLVSC